MSRTSAFVGSDNAGSLGGSLVFNFAGKPPTSYGPSTAVPSDAGSYAIRPSGLASDDYSFTYKAGTYTISKADQTITFAGRQRARVSGSGLRSGRDGELESAGELLGGCGRPMRDCCWKVHIAGAGSCTVTASQAGNNNYNAAPDVRAAFIDRQGRSDDQLPSDW